MEYFLNFKLRFIDDSYSNELSIKEMIDNGMKVILKRHGVAVDANYIIISNSHPELRKIFEGTRWEAGSWKNSLIRLEGAERKGNSRFGRLSTRGVSIPRNVFGIGSDKAV